MNNLQTTIIETKRLKLIPQSIEYAPFIFKEFTEEITTYMVPKSPKRIEDTMDHLTLVESSIEKGEEFPVVIIDKLTGEFIGCGGAHNLKTNKPELGIWIKKSAHGNRYGREAVEGLKKWIDRNIKYEYITYPVDKRNIASRKIAESLGGIVKSEYKKTNMAGNILDEVEYRIYPTE